MKVECQLCGTKFDQEVNRNTCPECGAYYHVDGAPRVYSEDNTHASFREDIPLKHKPRKPINKVKTVIIAVEIIAIIFCIIWPFVGMYNSKKMLEKQRITEKPTVVPKMIDEKIDVGDYFIQISDYYIDKEEYWNLPDNYVVYAVSYKTKHQGSSYISLYRAVQVYLETSDGMTISPLESYEAKEYLIPDRYQTMENNIGSYIKNDGGILYFVLKEDEEIYGLCFDVYECDQDDYNYKEIDTMYLMYLPELEVE